MVDRFDLCSPQSVVGNKENPDDWRLRFGATEGGEGAFPARTLKLGSVEANVELKAVCWTPHLQLGGFGGSAPKVHGGAFLEHQGSQQAASRAERLFLCWKNETSGCRDRDRM